MCSSDLCRFEPGRRQPAMNLAQKQNKVHYTSKYEWSSTAQPGRNPFAAFAHGKLNRAGARMYPSLGRVRCSVGIRVAHRLRLELPNGRLAFVVLVGCRGVPTDGAAPDSAMENAPCAHVGDALCECAMDRNWPQYECRRFFEWSRNRYVLPCDR